MKKVQIEKLNDCWIWIASRHPRGYGRFGREGRCDKAHRVSFEMFKGQIPKGLNVCHTCDNPPCVNPIHLFLGTQKDNINDMHSKSRNEKLRKATRASDETHQVSKLTNEDVRFMRSCGLSILELQEKFKHKVKKLAIQRVINRQTYKDVE